MKKVEEKHVSVLDGKCVGCDEEIKEKKFILIYKGEKNSATANYCLKCYLTVKKDESILKEIGLEIKLLVEELTK